MDLKQENELELKARDFICSCNKKYLSYAALFTHIKQKHGGKAPGPITRPRSQRKRGRPRKNNSDNFNNLSEKKSHSQLGIFKLNNNIQNPQNTIKTERAAELLDCGQFCAFQAYKPDIGQNLKKQIESESKLASFKKLKSRSFASPYKKSFSQLQICDKINKLSMKSAKRSLQFDDNLLLAECRQPLTKMFSEASTFVPSPQLQQYNIINQMTAPSRQGQEYTPLNIKQGFITIIHEFKDFLKESAVTQLTIFLNIFLKYLQSLSIQNILDQPHTYIIDQDLLTQFIQNYLKIQTQKLKIQQLRPFIFQKQHPIIIMTYLSNWIALHNRVQNSQPSYISQKNIFSPQKSISLGQEILKEQNDD